MNVIDANRFGLTEQRSSRADHEISRLANYVSENVEAIDADGTLSTAVGGGTEQAFPEYSDNQPPVVQLVPFRVYPYTDQTTKERRYHVYVPDGSVNVNGADVPVEDQTNDWWEVESGYESLEHYCVLSYDLEDEDDPESEVSKWYAQILNSSQVGDTSNYKGKHLAAKYHLFHVDWEDFKTLQQFQVGAIHYVSGGGSGSGGGDCPWTYDSASQSFRNPFISLNRDVYRVTDGNKEIKLPTGSSSDTSTASTEEEASLTDIYYVEITHPSYDSGTGTESEGASTGTTFQLKLVKSSDGSVPKSTLSTTYVYVATLGVSGQTEGIYDTLALQYYE